MKIKFGNVEINETSKAHVMDCLNSNHITMGPKTKKLEDIWAAKFGYADVKAVSSGTSACMAACMALYDLAGANPGDEVIVPGLSFIATATAVRAAGLVPVFCDIKCETMLIDETKIEACITNKTRAIMPVSLMGKPPKMDVIKSIANKHNLVIILDNCEGHGCKYQDKYMSHYADLVVYSCYAAHILFSGELGLVGCKTKGLGELISSIRSHGRPTNSLYFNHERFGLNLKPTDLHAAVGLGSMEEFDDTLRKRKENLDYLSNQLAGLSDYFWFVEEDSGDYNSPHGFSVTVKPDSGIPISAVQAALDKADIEWKRNFGAMQEHGVFSYLKNIPKCENASYVGNNGLHVGCHAYLSLADLERITHAISSCVASI